MTATKPLPGFSRYTPQPGHPDWQEVEQQVDLLVKDILQTIHVGPPSAQELLQDAQRIGGALTVNATSAFKNAQHLRKGGETLLPPYFIWTMHNTCNFRCTYCDNHQGEAYFNLRNEGKLNTEDGKKLLDIVGKNVRGIYFCGGEPTLRKDLPELVDHAWNQGYFPLMINTNGSRLNHILKDDRYKNWLRQMDIIIVSLDALDLDKLTKLWGVKKDQCQQVIVNILALRKLQEHVRFKLVINTVITPDTVEDANRLLDFANDMGIWFSAVPLNEGPAASMDLMENPAYQALREKILRRKNEGQKILGSPALLRRLLYGEHIQCFPTLKPHIDFDGGLYWPCKTKSDVDPFKINVLDFSSLEEAYQSAAKRINPKEFHGKGEGQCGADCNWMQNYVSDVYGRGLSHPFQTGLIREIAEFVGVA